MSIPGLEVDQENGGSTWSLGDLIVRGGLVSFGEVALSGFLHVQGSASFGRVGFSGLSFRGLPGSTLVVDGPATLYSGGVTGEEMAVNIECRSTSTLTPTAGTIRVVPGRSLSIRSAHDVALGTLVVPSTSSVHFTPLNFSSPASARVSNLQCFGTAFVMNPLVDMISGTGVVTLTESGGFGIPPYLGGLQGSVQVHWSGGQSVALHLSPSSGPFLIPLGSVMSTDGVLQVAGAIDVQGLLRVQPGGRLAAVANSTITVGATGELMLNGSAGSYCHLSGRFGSRTSILVSGRLSCRYAFLSELEVVRFSGTGSVAAEPMDLSDSMWIQDAGSASSCLFEFSAHQPIRVGTAHLLGTTPVPVRSTTASAVNLSRTSGSGFGAEDDPHGAVSWIQGVDLHGPAAPACRGVVTCEAGSRPTIGNSSFRLFTDNAAPSTGSFLVMGLTGLGAPILLGAVEAWIDLGGSTFSSFHLADTQGRVLSAQPIPQDPFLVGLTVYAQFLMFESESCVAGGLSASSATRFELLP